MDDEEGAEVAAHVAKVGDAGGVDAPVVAPAVFEQPVGEGAGGFELDEVGGDFGDVGGEFAAVETFVVGALLVEFGEKIGYLRAVEHGVGVRVFVCEEVLTDLRCELLHEFCELPKGVWPKIIIDRLRRRACRSARRF